MLYIDGNPVEFEAGRELNGFTDCHVYGVALSGRRSIVSVHSVPTVILDYCGRVKTGGHVYEYKRKGKTHDT